MNITFAPSTFPPLALGFFGLGTGYLIWGPSELVGWPRRGERERVDRGLGVWGIWMPGFCQFVAGIILFVGLSWFRVFREPPLYMAALAFTVFGVHWFAIGWNRYRGNDPRLNFGLAIAYMVVSAIGATVFFKAKDWPVGLLFLGLFAVYFFEFLTTVGIGIAERAMGLMRIFVGLWLMYLTYAVVVDFALGYHWRT
jgi:hypothetical protein